MVKVLAVALGLTALVPSQQTVLVGPNSGDLAAAVVAAGPWDTLVLPSGAGYGATVTVDKPLSIVGVAGLHPVIQSLTVVAGAVSGFVSLSQVDVWNADIRAPTSFEDGVISWGSITSTQVSLHRCVVGSVTSWMGPLVIQGGEVRLTACTLYGRAATSYSGGPVVCQTIPSASAINATGCQLWISDTTAIGGADHVTPCLFLIHVPASPAILGSGDLHISGGAIRGCAGTLPYGPAPAVQWNGTFERDPSTQFFPTMYQGTPRFLPRTVGNGAMRGSSMLPRVASLPNVPAVLAASLGMPSSAAWPQGTSWLDPSAYVVLAIGFTDAMGQLGVSIPVPTTVARGLVITVQGAVVLGSTGALAAAVPVVLHVL